MQTHRVFACMFGALAKIVSAAASVAWGERESPSRETPPTSRANEPWRSPARPASPSVVFDPVDFEGDRSVTDDFRPLWSSCKGSFHAPILLRFQANLAKALKKMVGAVRFELTTSCTRNKRASQATLRPEPQSCCGIHGFFDRPFDNLILLSDVWLRIRLAKNAILKFTPIRPIADVLCPIADKRQVDSSQAENKNSFGGQIALGRSDIFQIAIENGALPRVSGKPREIAYKEANQAARIRTV
jgi:hypothetical protein